MIGLNKVILVPNIKDSMAKYNRIFFITSIILLSFSFTQAQVSSVIFGKNRVQYKKFKWQYYQTKNFNTYFEENGMPLGKYVAQIAEQELPSIEKFVEYGLQRRANLIIYNHFYDLQ